jgi:hypothetical protein
VIAAIGIGLLGAAVVQQLRLPRSERTWHGTVAGVVPYDLRPSANLARIVVLLRDWRPVDE